jgi:hypothetical protein
MQAQGINIKLMADIVEVQRRFADVERLAERTANNIGASFAGLGAKLAGALSVGALAAWTKQVIDSIDQLNDLADATGASIENISKLEGAALRTGASLADVGGMLVKFNSALKDAKDQNGAALALQAIGVQAEALRQMDPADAVLTTARALAQFEDDGNKARIVQELFGKSAREVAPLLKDLAEAGELNATVTAQQAQEAEAFNKQLAGLQAQATLASRQIVGGLLPVMNAIVGAFSTGSKEGANFKGVVELLRVPLEAVAIAGANVWFVLESVGREIGAVAAQIAALGRGDFQAFSAISDMVKADGVRARAELDALQQRILNAGRESQTVATQAQGNARAALPDIVALGAAAKKSSEDAKAAEKARQDERDAASKRHLAYLKRIDEAEAEAEKKAQEYFKAEADRRKSELDQLATRELRAVQAYEEEEAAIDKRLKSAADMVAAIEHETATLQMSNTEREISNALLELERQGLVKGSYAYEEYAAKIRKAIVDREAVRESVQQVKTIRDEWQRMANQIEQSITDALMRGFESGKGFVENLRDTLVNTFKTMVLRPTVQAILAPVSGAMASVYSPGAVAGQAGTMQSAGMLQTMTQVYGAVKAGFTAIGDSVAFAAQDAGAWLMQHTTGALNKLGGQMMSSSGALGSAAGYGAGLAAGHYVGRAISGDYGSNATVNIATISGAVIGGPIGAAIGGVIGGLANRAFGMGNKQVTGQGIRGTFSGDSFSGSQYATMLQKGGWFRSDRNWTETSGLDAGTQQALSQGFASIKAATASLASGLGGSALAVKLYSQQINLALTSDAEKNKEIITKLFTDMGDTLARIAVPSIDKFRRENETAAAALQRLSTDLTAVNRVLDTLGQTAFSVSAEGADAASKLAGMFGGAEGFQQAAAAYYEKFYSEEQRTASAAAELAESMAALGYSMPATHKEFRDLVDAQDRATDSGRQTYASLIALSTGFDDLTKAMETMAEQAMTALGNLVDGLKQSLAGERGQVASALAGFGATGGRSAAQIRESMSGLIPGAPSAAAAVASQQALADAYRAVPIAEDLMKRSAAASTEISTARAGYNAAAGTSAAALQALREAEAVLANTPKTYTYDPGFFYKNEQRANPAYATQQTVVANAQRVYDAAATSAAASLATLNSKVSQFGSLSDQAASAVVAYNAAVAARNTAETNAITAASNYAAALRQYIDDAGKSVKKLSALREETVSWYQDQAALATAMVDGAQRLRVAVTAARLGQLDAGQSLSQGMASFARNYSMALVTSGQTQVGYADKLAEALPELSEGLKQRSATRAQWAVATAQLFAQSQTIANQLEANAPTDYQQVAADLLGNIDITLAAIESVTASAEKVISDAIYTTSGQNLSGLRAIVAALQGKPVPAFASGGIHAGGLRLVGENGPELEATGPARIYSSAQTRSMLAGEQMNTARLEALVERLTQEVADLRAEARSTAVATNKTARILDRVTPDGNSLQTTAAA